MMDKPLDKIKPLVLGGAVLNQQYNDDPHSLGIVDILKTGIESGLVNCIDTSPYYGPSEEIYGNAIQRLQQEHGLWTNRDEYYVITKCGRVQLDEFDYSREWIRKSVLRSVERLQCGYLDCVYLHDVEFNDEAAIFEALRELHRLKTQDKVILNFGISGYPVNFLYKISLKSVGMPDVGRLDCILTYCNGCLQNTTAFKKAPDFLAPDKSGLKLFSNGSILSMSLLSGRPIKPFHPCQQELKDVFNNEVKEYCAVQGVCLPALATKYAISQFHSYGPTVVGVSSVAELNTAIDTYRELAKNNMALTKEDQTHVSYIQNELLGSRNLLNLTWASGKH